MSKVPLQEESNPDKPVSIRQGTTIVAAGQGLRFEIPASWVKWYETNTGHPNLHLTSTELDMVRETEGEWDQEFALVVNAILPFERCVAHVGGEGWGPRALSYADLQVRAYVLMSSPEEIEDRARSQGPVVIATFTKTDLILQHDPVQPWRRTLLKYFRMYHDYGATAMIELRLQGFGTHTVAFVFMYTDHSDHSAEINMILNSAIYTDT